MTIYTVDGIDRQGGYAVDGMHGPKACSYAFATS